MIVKGFESALRERVNEAACGDTLKILKLSRDTMILKDEEETLVLHKK